MLSGCGKSDFESCVDYWEDAANDEFPDNKQARKNAEKQYVRANCNSEAMSKGAGSASTQSKTSSKPREKTLSQLKAAYKADLMTKSEYKAEAEKLRMAYDKKGV